MNFLFRLKKYCNHRFHARKGKNHHSPFVYNFSLAVFDSDSSGLLRFTRNDVTHNIKSKQVRLLSKIVTYCNIKTITSFPSENSTPPHQANIIVIDLVPNPEQAFNYFEETAKYADNNSVIIVKSLYRSKENALVWEKIKAHPKTTVTFDLFKIGIVFFRRESSKENFIIKY
jgi:hypothetical protein